jgi:hypothetical protein
MKAVTFQGAKDIQVKEVADPKLHTNDGWRIRSDGNYHASGPT